jgi:hypothetical protein
MHPKDFVSREEDAIATHKLKLFFCEYFDCTPRQISRFIQATIDNAKRN